MAFVLVQHLDPKHKSSLVDLLSQVTPLPVSEVKQGQKVEPNHVYVIPENKEITIKNAELQLHNREASKQPNLSINRFLTSLADDQQTNAIGIILSGAGSDGTLGLQAIKAAGGITFVQDESADYASMPESAIRAGAADFTLDPAAIAKGLRAVGNHPHVQQPASDDTESITETEDFPRILQLLEKQTGVAMTSYKTAMLQRRTRRRLAVLNLQNFAEYAAYLEGNTTEREILYQDMLINVTSFFRDQSTLDLLREKLLPELLSNVQQDRTLRIWVAGCASGEEAYSIAITCHEVLSKHSSNVSIKIFATDLNPVAIATARSGLYPVGALEKVSKEIRERYFDPVGQDSYQVKDFLREMCIFAVHNLLVDPPFSAMDYISCCNVMIYLLSAAQQKLLTSFHYALKPDGFLALGSSESIGSSRSLFTSIDKKLKVYRRKQATPPQFFETHRRPSRPVAASTQRTATPRSDKLDIATVADNVLLSQYIVPSVVVDSALEIVEFYGITSPYLEAGSGKASLNLLKMARPGLVLHLRQVIRNVKEKGEPYKSVVHVKLTPKSQAKQITLEAIPLDPSDSADSHILVVFGAEHAAEEATTVQTRAGSDSSANQIKNAAQDAHIIQLERELTEQQEEARHLSDDHDIAIEELQLANEEVRSSNEELQSLNEELETSSEELASTNEELLSMNQTLRASNEALRVARDYAEAIIATVRHPLIVLDLDLKVVTANTAFFRTFEVSEKATTGSYIYNLGNGQWQIPELRSLLDQVTSKNDEFQDFQITHNFQDIGLKTMLLDARRMQQEKGRDKLILLAIEDITKRLDDERALQASDERLRFMAESMPQKVFTNTPNGELDYFNPQWMEFTGLTFEVLKGWGWTKFVHPDDVDETVERWKQAVKSGDFFRIEHRFRRADGVYHWHLTMSNALRDESGKIIMWTGSSTDVEDLKRSEKRTVELEQSTVMLKHQRNQLMALNNAKQEFISLASHQLRTPATGVKQYVGMLLEGYAGDLSSIQRQYLEGANRSNDRQLRIIDDLLKVARVDSEYMTLELVSTDLVLLTQSVLDEEAANFVERQQLMTFYPAQPSMVVWIDSEKIRMVLENLIDNASKFTPRGKGVSVGLEMSDSDIKIIVKDEGVGIKERDQDYLFQKFYRIDNDMSIRVGGTGLGLYLVKKIVDLHRGSITVSSVPDKGSTFTVTLPIDQEQNMLKP